MKHDKKLEKKLKEFRDQYVSDPPILLEPERKFYTADEIKQLDFEQWTVWQLFCTLVPLSNEFREQVLEMEQGFEFPEHLPDYLPMDYGYCVREQFTFDWNGFKIVLVRDTGDYCKTGFDYFFDRNRFLFCKYYSIVSFKGHAVSDEKERMAVLRKASIDLSQKVLAFQNELREKLDSVSKLKEKD